MQDLLFLAHRIPFPPNKGDKIRSFNLLKHLAQDYRVHLGAFIDDPADWRYVDEVRDFCEAVHFVPLHTRLARLRSLTGLLRHQPLTLPYYRSRRMQSWVDSVLERSSLRRVLVFSAAMAQYVDGSQYRHLHRVIDFVDVDSDKWLQYARSKHWPMNWIYRREGRTLLAYERRIASAFAASVLVSAEEAALFRRLAPETAERIFAISNGVDTDFFNPDVDYPNPYPAGRQVLVFTGAMDYWANVDAVAWFARELFPQIRQAAPQAWFYIVGARPTATVRQLGALPGVCVTGGVRDIRPYLAHAYAAVAPLRIARGVQNKVLEAMAMARPVLATRAALDGIVACPELERLASDDPKRIVELALNLLRDRDADGCDAIGRRWISRHYNWPENLSRFERLFDDNAELSSNGTNPAQPGLCP